MGGVLRGWRGAALTCLGSCGGGGGGAVVVIGIGGLGLHQSKEGVRRSIARSSRSRV